MNAAASRLGIRLPIVQAPIGSATTPALAAAVSNAGGLGMLAGTWQSPDLLRGLIAQTRALTDRPFGLNLVLAFDPQERLRAGLEAGVRIFSFFWGDPAPWVGAVHQAGGVVIHTAGDAREAAAAAAAGVDVLVAQGVEAGGHVRGTTPLATLIGEVKGAAPGVPVLAAGGIGDGRGARAALRRGADGVWLGTRFVASDESGAHPDYKRRLAAATAGETLRGVVFDIGWPAAPHRMLRNSTVRAWEAAGRPAPGVRPGEGDLVARYPDGRPVVRYEDMIPVEGMTGDLEALALYAGCSVDAVPDTRPAARIVAELATGLR